MKELLDVNRIYNEDSLGDNGMCLIPDKSVDLILADLPYGTTQCKWDSKLSLDDTWKHYLRIIKDDGAIVLTAAQPFASQLVMSNPKLFKYDLIWEKTKATGHLNAKKMPLRAHEHILVFYKKSPVYNPQMTEGEPYKARGFEKSSRSTNVYGDYGGRRNDNDGFRYPRSVLQFAYESKPIHDTQKPLPLFEYLVKTYSNEGETVLDNVIGSGTTAHACVNLNRNFIGFEWNDSENQYYVDCIERVRNGIVAVGKQAMYVNMFK